MKLTFNQTALEEIMRLFYSLTGIRFVLAEADGKEIVSFPPTPASLCQRISRHHQWGDICRAEELQTLSAYQNVGSTELRKCPAGLIKGMAPIFSHSHHVACYAMFGPVANRKDKRELNRLIRHNRSTDNALTPNEPIQYHSDEQIQTAAKLLAFCAEHIMLKDIVSVGKSQQFVRAKEYIDAHLSEDLDIRDIFAYAATSRTDLYNIFRHEYSAGIAHYIKEKRMKKAKELLKTTDLSVAEISGQVGFSNYNYFSRIFKQHFGVSPHRYRHDRNIPSPEVT